MVDIDVLVARLARAQHRVVTRAQLLERNVTRFQVDRAIKRGLLVPVYPGVFLVGGGEPGFESSILAAVWASKGFASHRAAAALFGLRRVPTGHLEVTVDRRASRLAGVTVHEMRGLTPSDQSRIGIIPVLHPAVVLLQLAGADPDLVEGALDDVLVRRLASLAAVERTLNRLGGRGRQGAPLLRELVAERRAGQQPTESALEDEFVTLASAFRLELPSRQLPVPLEGGPDARCDFGDPDRQLDLEIDGARYHAGHSDQHRDAERDDRVRVRGWAVRRFTTEDIRERPEKVAAVVRALQLRLPRWESA